MDLTSDKLSATSKDNYAGLELMASREMTIIDSDIAISNGSLCAIMDDRYATPHEMDLSVLCDGMNMTRRQRIDQLAIDTIRLDIETFSNGSRSMYFDIFVTGWLIMTDTETEEDLLIIGSIEDGLRLCGNLYAIHGIENYLREASTKSSAQAKSHNGDDE